jgi:anthranilate synthase/aminodeoxychorismate synthase-like glutamine amidotransferase
MIVIIDNFDSFVWNLVRYVREEGGEAHVLRNDAATVDEVTALRPHGFILSPGPHAPREAGICLPLLRALDAQTPVLGVCLGHQCLIEACGGRTVAARQPLHGEASPIRHDGSGLLAGFPDPFPAGRYHSLVGDIADAKNLLANAWSEEGEIMGVRRDDAPWHGVQFHPESLLTPLGRLIVRRFVALTREMRP